MSVYMPSLGGGWKCAHCGAFVPLNTSHECPLSNSNSPALTYSTPLLPVLERIAAALEKIAAKLEKGE